MLASKSIRRFPWSSAWATSEQSPMAETADESPEPGAAPSAPQKSAKRTTPAEVLIVGGGFGGLAAARALRGADVNVTLVDRSNHHLFQPLLYQVATAGL